jgi:hypothetical protein
MGDCPAAGVKDSRELQRQAEIATYCLRNPNADDSWRTLAEQVIEDVLAARAPWKPSGQVIRCVRSGFTRSMASRSRSIRVVGQA